MKSKYLLISLLALTGCFKNYIPDESLVVQGSDLILPPNYELSEPTMVNSIYEDTYESAEEASKRILLETTNTNTKSMTKTDKKKQNLNKWLLQKAGGQARIANIKNILQDDIKHEEDK